MAEEKEAKKAEKADVKEAKAEKEAKKADNKSSKADKKAKKDKKSRKNPFKAIGAFFKGVRSEGKKVVWPKAYEVFKNTIVVLVVILILGVLIYLVDLGLSEGMKGVKKLAETTTAAEETDAASSDETLDQNTEADTSEPTVEVEEEAAE